MFSKIKRIVSVLAALCLITAFAACGKNSAEKQILGSWTPAGEDEYVTFYSNGTLYAAGDTGTWSITDNEKLDMTIDGDTLSVKITHISSDSMTWELEDESINLVKHE